MKLIEKQIREGRIYALFPQYLEKVNKARADIKTMLLQYPKSYVALSWGKQSTAMAHLVYNIEPLALCVHWTSPYAELIADFNNVKNRFIRKWGIQYKELTEGKSGELKKAIKEFVNQYKPHGVFVGLAACESKGRKHTLNKNDSSNIFIYNSGMARCCPLSNWTNQDIAAYVSQYELPLLSTYVKYGLNARTSVGVTPGKHAEKGIDLLNSENIARIKQLWEVNNV